jgi:hypothetical protein
VRHPPLSTVAVLAITLSVLAGCEDEPATDGAGGGSGDTRAVNDQDAWLERADARMADIRGPGLIREIYIGVACPNANRLRCDRVGVAIRLRDHGARRLRAWVASRAVKMRPVESGEEARPREPHRYWEGYLQPAGLVDGPLRSLAQSGTFRWEGRPSVAASVRIDARSSGHWTTLGARRGALFSARFEDVSLHAGFG